MPKCSAWCVNRYSPDRCKNWKKEWDLNNVCCDDYPRYVGSDQKFRKDKCCGNLNYCKDKQNCCYNAGGPTNFILVESRFDCGRESS